MVDEKESHDTHYAGVNEHAEVEKKMGRGGRRRREHQESWLICRNLLTRQDYVYIRKIREQRGAIEEEEVGFRVTYVANGKHPSDKICQ